MCKFLPKSGNFFPKTSGMSFLNLLFISVAIGKLFDISIISCNRSTVNDSCMLFSLNAENLALSFAPERNNFTLGDTAICAVTYLKGAVCVLLADSHYQ